jgi:hypothetical protein
MFLKEDAFHATCHTIGIPISINAYLVRLVLSIIPKLEDVFARVSDHIWSTMNVLHASSQTIGMKQPITVRFAHKPLSMTLTK